MEAGTPSSTHGPILLGTGRIQILPRRGGAATFTVAGLDLPTAVLDSSTVYWAEAWRVGAAARVAGTATTLASGIRDPLPRIAVTGARLLVGARTRYVPGLVLAELDDFLRNERPAMRAFMADLRRGAFTFAPAALSPRRATPARPEAPCCSR